MEEDEGVDPYVESDEKESVARCEGRKVEYEEEGSCCAGAAAIGEGIDADLEVANEFARKLRID